MTKPQKRILEGWQTEAEWAEECEASVQTVRRARRLGIGPPWARVPGIGVIYNIESSREWLRNKTVQPRRTRA